MQVEGNLLLQNINLNAQNPIDFNKVVDGLTATIPAGMSDEEKNAVINMLKNLKYLNQNNDQFWNIYNKEKQNLIATINHGALDRYTPIQIRISIDNALKKLNHISIIGCDGYTKMKKISKRII